MKKKTSPLTLNVKAEGYAMNAQLICEDSQGNKVELTSKGTNRINLGMVRWFINILLLITWAEVFWDSCFGRQFMFQDSNVQSCGKKWYENAWGPEREGGPIFSRHGPLPQIARILLACFAASPLSENLVQAMFWKPCCILLGSAWFAVGLLPAQWQFCFQSVRTVAANLIIGCGSYCELYIRLMLVSFSAFCLSYCRVVESVGEVVSTILGRMKLSRANRSLWALLKQINRIEESFLSLLDF